MRLKILCLTCVTYKLPPSHIDGPEGNFVADMGTKQIQKHWQIWGWIVPYIYPTTWHYTFNSWLWAHYAFSMLLLFLVCRGKMHVNLGGILNFVQFVRHLIRIDTLFNLITGWLLHNIHIWSQDALKPPFF